MTHSGNSRALREIQSQPAAPPRRPRRRPATAEARGEAHARRGHVVEHTVLPLRLPPYPGESAGAGSFRAARVVLSPRGRPADVCTELLNSAGRHRRAEGQCSPDQRRGASGARLVPTQWQRRCAKGTVQHSPPADLLDRLPFHAHRDASILAQPLTGCPLGRLRCECRFGDCCHRILLLRVRFSEQLGRFRPLNPKP